MIRSSGFSLYNLKNDPFELNNLALKNEASRKYMDLINEIQAYVAEEMQKGIEYPLTGKLKGGKLLAKIMRKIPFEEKIQHYYDTGRIYAFDRY